MTHTASAAHPAPPAPRRVDLALQGGGSHGAFTWGVLDRLLEEDGLAIGAISGTSAGALNAAVWPPAMRAAAGPGRAPRWRRSGAT
jgi:NTE family protein